MSTQIDLSKYPKPKIFVRPDEEPLLSQLIDEVVAQFPVDEAEAAARDLPSQASLRALLHGANGAIVTTILQALTYHIGQWVDQHNQLYVAGMVAFARGPGLDYLGVLNGVHRKSDEADARFRQRIADGPEAYSTAGPVGAYIQHALAAHDAILDVSVDSPRFASYPLSAAQKTVLPENLLVAQVVHDAALDAPMPTDIAITVLLREGIERDPKILEAVSAVLNHESTRPDTDRVRVRWAQKIPYAISAQVQLDHGAAPEIVKASIDSALRDYCTQTRRLGRRVALSEIYAALQQPGVAYATLLEPKADMICAKHEAGEVQSIHVQYL